MADDFSGPGNDGGHIPAEYDKDEPGTSVAWSPPPPAELPAAFQCGKRYYLRAKREDHGVAAADGPRRLERAYVELRDLLEARAAALAGRCPQNCRPLHTWIAWRGWRYHPSEELIRVTVILGLLCPPAGANKPAGLPRLPDSDDFEDPRDEEDDGEYRLSDGWGEIWHLEGAEPSVRCGDRRLIRFTYRASVRSCDAADYATYVPRARELARWYLDQVRCRDARVQTLDGTRYVECERKASLLRTEWDCDRVREEVVVDVYLAVRCVTPRL